MKLQVSRVRFSPARKRRLLSGLIGLTSVQLNDAFVIHRIAIRRASDGRIVVSFPAPRDHRGRCVPLAHPLDAAGHADLEQQILAELRRQGWIQP